MFVSQRSRGEALNSESLVESLDMIQQGQIHWKALRVFQVVLELCPAPGYQPPLRFHGVLFLCQKCSCFP